jgi:hypothetical protein
VRNRSKLSLKNTLIIVMLGTACITVTVIILVMALSTEIKTWGAYEDINALASEQLTDDGHYGGEVKTVYAKYAEYGEERAGLPIGGASYPYRYYYIVSAKTESMPGEARFISVSLEDGTDIAKANKMLEAYESGEAYTGEKLYIDGLCEPLESDIYLLLKSGAEQSGIVKDTGEFNRYFLPYNIKQP